MGNFEEEKIVYYLSSSIEEAEETIEQFQKPSDGEQAFASLASKLNITTGDLKRAGALEIWDGTKTILVERNLEDTSSTPQKLILPERASHQTAEKETIIGAENLPTGEPVEDYIVVDGMDDSLNSLEPPTLEDYSKPFSSGKAEIDAPVPGSTEATAFNEKENIDNSTDDSILGHEYLPTGEPVEDYAVVGGPNEALNLEKWTLYNIDSAERASLEAGSIKRGGLLSKFMQHNRITPQEKEYYLSVGTSALNSKSSSSENEFLPSGESVQPVIVHEDGYVQTTASGSELTFEEQLSGAGLDKFSSERAEELTDLQKTEANLPTGNPVSAVIVEEGSVHTETGAMIKELIYSDSNKLSGAGLDNINPEQAAELAYLEETESNLPVGSLESSTGLNIASQLIGRPLGYAKSLLELMWETARGRTNKMKISENKTPRANLRPQTGMSPYQE